MMDRAEYDVVVMGGGLAGLTFARQLLLNRPDTSVLVAERMPHPVQEAAHKVGEATVEMSAHYFAEVLQLRDHLERDQLRKMGLRFLPAVQTPPPPLSQRAEVGPSDFLPRRTYQLDRGRFENALGQIVSRQGATFCDGCRIERFELDRAGHTVTLNRGGDRASVTARWLVDASGRRGLIKSKLHLQQPVGHDCNAVWLRLGDMIWMDDLVDEQRPADDSAAAAWRARVPNGQRWRSTNHLMGRGWWAWLIPLASGSISVGLVADPRYVPFDEINTLDGLIAWLNDHEPELGRAVEQRRGSLLDFRFLRHFAHGCKQVFSADRWALTGEAGVFNDPLYSPGSDFIALSNTLLTKLVVRELDGEPVDELAAHSNAYYLEAFHAALPVWENQYRLMGNPQVWSVKFVWDIFTYFSVLGVLNHNEGLTDVRFMASVRKPYERFVRLNHRMQAFFREWDDRDGGTDTDAFVNVNSVDIVREFAEALENPLDLDTVRARFDDIVDFVEDVARVIIAGAATRTGLPIQAADVDPMTFSFESADEQPAGGSDREDSLRRAAEMLDGVWHDVASVTP